MAKGIIFDIKEFSVNDGPGIRTTIFFKGCPLRCLWCHNPEGISPRPQLKISGLSCLGCGKCSVPCTHEECKPFGRCIHVCPQGRLSLCGKEVDSVELASMVNRQAHFLSENNGGVTFSGGEPLNQPKFLFELMAELKPMHLAVETSGYSNDLVFRKMMDLTDLILIDIKHMNSPLHRRYTGIGNEQILSNINQLIQGDKPFIIRIPLIPGVNDDTSNMQAIAEFLTGARSLSRVELMPYNVLAGAKYPPVGLEYKPNFNVNTPPHIDRSPFISRGIECVVLRFLRNYSDIWEKTTQHPEIRAFSSHV